MCVYSMDVTDVFYQLWVNRNSARLGGFQQNLKHSESRPGVCSVGEKTKDFLAFHQEIVVLILMTP